VTNAVVFGRFDVRKVDAEIGGARANGGRSEDVMILSELARGGGPLEERWRGWL
jgi:hypothetical protein